MPRHIDHELQPDPRETPVGGVFDLRQQTNFVRMGRADHRRIVYAVGQPGRKRQ
jgi:hypothetical protein